MTKEEKIKYLIVYCLKNLRYDHPSYEEIVKLLFTIDLFFLIYTKKKLVDYDYKYCLESDSNGIKDQLNHLTEKGVLEKIALESQYAYRLVSKVAHSSLMNKLETFVSDRNLGIVLDVLDGYTKLGFMTLVELTYALANESEVSYKLLEEAALSVDSDDYGLEIDY